MMKKSTPEMMEKCTQLHREFDRLSDQINDENVMVNVMAAYLAELILSQDDKLEAFMKLIEALGCYINVISANYQNEFDVDIDFND